MGISKNVTKKAINMLVNKIEEILEIDQLKDLVEQVRKVVKSGFILLDGDLGAGKTTFVKHFLQSYGIEEVTSPTFGYVQRYDYDQQDIFHADLYRVEYATQLRDLELEFYHNELFLVEWGLRFEEYLQPVRAKIYIKIDSASSQKRHYTVEFLN